MLASALVRDLLELPYTPKVAPRSSRPRMINPKHRPPPIPSSYHLADLGVQVSPARMFHKHPRLPFPAPRGRTARKARQLKINGAAALANPPVAHQRSHRTARRR